MGIFSEELLQMDRNTVHYMIDQLQEALDQEKKLVAQKDKELAAVKLHLIERVRKKYMKAVPTEQCAEMLEENPDQVRRIYELIAAHPDWDDRQIVDAMMTTD